MKPEARVKRSVKETLKRHSAYYFMPVQMGYGAPTLDFLGCHKGRAFAIETKAPGKTLTPRQEQTIGEMLRAGMKVFVIGEKEYRNEPTETSTRFSGELELEAWLLELVP
jgi:hypothetical protein